MGIIIRHATLFINLPSTEKPMLKPLILSVITLCSRHPIIKKKPADKSNYISRNT